VQLTDPESGDLVSPTSLVWTLTDKDWTTINGRASVATSPTAGQTEVEIGLSGADLQIQDSETSRRFVERRLIIEATYNSAETSDIPANEIVYFYLENLGL
jgi:hypothetical protein